MSNTYKVVFKNAPAITRPHPDPGPHTVTYGGQTVSVTYPDPKSPDVSFKCHSYVLAKDNGDGTYLWALAIEESVEPGEIVSEGTPPEGIDVGYFAGLNVPNG